MSVDDCRNIIETESTTLRKERDDFKEKLASVKTEMAILKKRLYSKFKDSINLDE